MVSTSAWDTYLCALLTFFWDIDAIFFVISKNKTMFLKFKEQSYYVIYGYSWQRKIRIAQVKIPQPVGLADVDQKHQGQTIEILTA